MRLKLACLGGVPAMQLGLKRTSVSDNVDDIIVSEAACSALAGVVSS